MRNRRIKEITGDEYNSSDEHYRAYVGPPERYDLMSAIQFNLLTGIGLRQEHKLLDIGCGSLRAGKLFIPYLLPGNYYGIEPNEWLIKDGFKYELGEGIKEVKSPHFNNNNEFNLSVFNEKFDYIIAQSIFSHSSAENISKCFSQAKKVLKQEGIFAATYVEGEKNYEGKNWVYGNCVTYKYDYIKNLAEQNGLKCMSYNFYHPGQNWILLTLPEKVNEIPKLDEKINFIQKSEINELQRIKRRLERIEKNIVFRILRKIKRILK